MINTSQIVIDIDLPNVPLFKKGKVRSVFDLGDQLLIVASDRVSAFDYVLPNGIPNKGQVLTQVSEFWFNYLSDITPNHLISTNVEDFPSILSPYKDILAGRSMLVKKTELIEIECVVRGYIVGSGWKEYQQSGTVCGIKLPPNLKLADPLPEPIFTPAFKASSGHDENITIEKMESLVGKKLTQYLSKKSIEIYKKGVEYAKNRGIILADTKFEFGKLNDDVILIDEVLTPDSSRFWPISEYQPGISPPSFDKQIVRDYLASTNWDQKPPIPTIPDEIINKTSQKYLEVSDLLIK
ncbi:phosphoribosylaminoimidazolesuccinocarboxamide synthase [Candidatus Marinamargulisbacteria bacterium SCGC AG-410-N11]|nr:phosphoribosylaminoimidazolesuccinocarboxamide synthase [Candidatus Marinamargulisbacteria bacterium SCGC AG-410-N11]